MITALYVRMYVLVAYIGDLMAQLDVFLSVKPKAKQTVQVCLVWNEHDTANE